jgi:di/tricarboxylate transporter
MLTEIDWHALATLLIVVATFWSFATEKIPVQTTALLSVLALMLVFGVLPRGPGTPELGPAQFLAGFGHPALVTICCLMVLGHGLVITGALEPTARLLGRLFKVFPSLATLLMLVFCMVLSGVINDTPIVVLMMPVLLAVAARSGVQASQTLMPMNCAVLIGGMATTIGTSTNLLVVGLAEDLGMRPFGVFEFTPLVAVAAAMTLPYLWWVMPRLLPRNATGSAAAEPLVFRAQMLVRAGGYADGRKISDKRFQIERFTLIKVARGGMLLPLTPELVLAAGDLLTVETPAEDLREHAATLGLVPQPLSQATAGDPANQVLAQVMLVQDSEYTGSVQAPVRFASDTGLGVMAVHRRSEQTPRSGSEWLRPGDILLVQGSRADVDSSKSIANILVLDATLDLPYTAKAPVALAIMAGVVALAASGLLPMVLASALGVAALMLAGCLRWKDASTALSSHVIMIVMASLALGTALSATGLTAQVSELLAWFGKFAPPVVMLAMLMLLMAVLTNFVSNNAAAIIGTPIAFSMATSLGLDPRPFVIAVIFGCNLCYATPMGYQTNLLIASAAGYRFKDFVRAGGPLLLFMWGALTWMLAAQYGML